MRERVFQPTTPPAAPDASGAAASAAVRADQCEYCRRLFEPPRAWSTFCSVVCRRAHERVAREIGRQVLAHHNAGDVRVVVENTPGGEPKVITDQAELPLSPPPLDTRRAARQNIEGTGRAQRLRERALEVLQRHGPRTADETAEILNESPFAVRPRFTELRKLGAIVDTGERRRNKSGNTARVWRAVR